MKNQLILLSLIMLSIFAVSNSKITNAYGPNTHVSWALDVVNETQDDTLIKELVRNNEDAYLCGLLYPDSAVIYYYSSFQTYKGLHDWNTADALFKAATNDRQRAFAIGWATHCAMDMVSHNYYIPDKIKATKLINPIIHPLYELITDTHYINVKASHAMEIHPEFDAWVAGVVGRDFSKEAELLNQAVGGGNFYQQSYTLPQQGWLYKTYSLLSQVVKPFVSESMYHPYMDRTKEEVRNIFRDNYASLDPSGEKALSDADAQAQLWQWAIGIGVIALMYFGARKLRWI
jgi:hypothetical protein